MSDLRRIALLLCTAIQLGQAPATAQDTDAAQAGEPAVAPVILDGDTLFSVRGVSSFPAERRAARIASAIRDFAADRAVPTQSLVVEEQALGSVLTAGGQRVMAVVDADAELEGVSRSLLAEAYRQRIAEAAAEYRREREPAALWRSLARATMATLGTILGLWLAARALRRLRSALDRRYRARVSSLQIQNFEIVRAEQLWQALHRAINVVAVVVALVALYLYLDYVLVLFPWTRSLGQNLFAVVLRPLTTLGNGAVRYLPDLVFLAVLALFTRWLLKLGRLFFRRVADGTIALSGFDPEWALPTERILRLLLIAFALVIAYPYIPGSGSEAFKGISLMLGLVFSLGSSSVISNVVAGQSLAFRRAFKVGDRVKIGEHTGEVTEIRLLTTFLRSPKNEQIVIPNSNILNSDVVNYSTLASQSGLILHTMVGIGYETPWRQVEAMLLEAAARTPGLLREPPPFVLQKALGTFAVDYEINVYCDNTRGLLLLYTALHRNILDVFNEYGVQIMTPAYEGDTEQPKVVPRENWYLAPAAGRAGGDGRGTHPNGGESASGSMGGSRSG
ncbi:MAG TPA: mechanosensitive ion channel family protein [Gemmatimonadales bacterium]|nr:mechanosensitive ion channel family protein [Gemmatimonadales bacterium]